MRGALAVLGLVLGFACGPLHAQAEKEPSVAKPRPQDQRARERTARDPAPDHRGHTVSKDSQPPKGAPSKAQQMQQKAIQDDAPRVVQCHARPVCGGGGYGACQEVLETYTGGANLRASRRDIVRRCEQANVPDTCQCAAQCQRVAQCSIF